MDGHSIVPRATVSRICAHRQRAIALFGEAHAAISAANDAIRRATAELGAASGGATNSYNHHSDLAKKCLMHGITIAEREAYMTEAQRVVDIDVWAHVIDITDLQRIMDKTAKDALRDELTNNPPPATEENIAATLRQFAGDAEMIFQRGVATCFSALDRRFRSHDGWKIGSRVILSYAFDDWGSWSYRSNHRDTLHDIERAFMVLDGQRVPDQWGGLNAAIDRSRHGHHGRRQSITETEFFKVCAYKNGNAHVWFKRDDLLEKVNKLLAAYYGEVIPEDREPDEDTGLNVPKQTLAKRYGFYPTPDPAVDAMLRDVSLLRDKDEPQLTILEPSAGTGNLSRRCARSAAELDNHSGGRARWMDQYRFDNLVDVVEIQPELAAALRSSGLYRRVTQADFLALRPDPTALYDRVVMNPPFDRERDIDHVMHAAKFLKPDGLLVAIMSAGTEFRETRKSIAFRAFIAEKHGSMRDLPAGSFSSVGTNINTVVVKFWNDGRPAR